MEWLSVAEISSITNIPENTIRRYSKVYSRHFRAKQYGKTKKYSSDAVELVKAIYSYYQAGTNTDEIREILQGQHSQVLDVQEEPHHKPITTLQLQQEVANFTQIVASMGEKMGEQQEDTIRQLMEINHRLDAIQAAVEAKKKPLFRRLMWWKG